MRIESKVGVTVVLLVAFGGAIAAERQQCRVSPLPSNVHFLHDIDDAIRVIYDRSASFRAQCARIAEADHLRVTVRINPSMPSRCRAFTIVQRHGRRIRADVHLPPSSDHAELLAHEFEHILEQIEGLDLRRLSRLKASGVFETDYAVFETERAQTAGRIVRQETRRRGVRAAD
jgi:hypothetical protein